MAMSLYLASLAPRLEADGAHAGFELVPFWTALTFPDAWCLDLDRNTLTKLFFGGVPGS